MKLRLWLLCLMALTASLRADGPVLTATRQGQKVFLTWPTNDSSFGLQYATALPTTNWTTINTATATNGLFTVTESATNAARYYQLISPCGVIAPPVIIVTKVRGTTNVPVQITDFNDAVANLINNGGVNLPASALTTVLNASQSYDPASCSSDTLTFHWIIKYGNPIINPYADAGITGYLTPKLVITVSSLLPSSVGLNSPVEFELTVTSLKTGLETIAPIYCFVNPTSLTVSVFNQCQTCTAPCSSCTIAAAKPAPPGTF